jgi:hypothetical protein
VPIENGIGFDKLESIITAFNDYNMTDMLIDMNEHMMSSCWGDEAIADTQTNTVQLVVKKNNKLTWGIPLERVVEIPEDGESLMKYMEYCSKKMEILAKEREKFKDMPEAVAYIQHIAHTKRFWTIKRSEYAEHYLESDLATAHEMGIRELQTEIDAAKMAGDWEGYAYMLPEIEYLRKTMALYKKWAEDKKKLD